MAGSCTGMKCLGSGVGFGNGVSKVGLSAPRPLPSETSIHGYHLVPDASTTWNAATIVVVITAVLALVGMIMMVIVLRRMRIRDQQLWNIAENINVAKAGQSEKDVNKEGKWSAEAVELVVMAGETQPTFLAHPVPTPANHPIQCPPLILPKDHPNP